jgi:hypothetical protein
LRCEAAVDVARQNMHAAALELLLSDGVVHEGIRYGALHQDDPTRAGLVETARSTTADYRLAWQEVTLAREALTQATRTHERTQQEAWMRLHRHDLVQALTAAEAAVASAADDRQRYVAKDRHRRTLFAYQTALLQAPVNGRVH